MKITNFTDNLSVLSYDLRESSKIVSVQRLLKGIGGYHHFRAKVGCQSVWRALQWGGMLSYANAGLVGMISRSLSEGNAARVKEGECL